MSKQKSTFKITIIGNDKQDTYECVNEKEKNQRLYNFLTEEEKMWAWEQWRNSNFKTFNKWFKEFIKPKWKESSFQSLYVNKKLILIKKENK